MKRKIKNIPHSIHRRLLSKAQEINEPFALVLQRYAIERFLYRLGKSSYAKKFYLKGALLHQIWNAPIIRPTKDIDLLGLVAGTKEVLGNIFTECMLIHEEDGLIFHPDTIAAEKITEDAEYEGLRFHFAATMGRAKIKMQIDVGIGDVVYPKPVWIDFPTLLDQEMPHLIAYTPESSIAEKYQAMIKLEMANSRMKDYFDIWLLSKSMNFRGEVLSEAIRKTFARRITPLPSTTPVSLSADFYENDTKKKQWAAFLKKCELTNKTPPLKEVIALLVAFLMPPTKALVNESIFLKTWNTDGLWK